ncbi:DUF3307 domain-containing protein [Krasilnikovia sp. M28-CT-15]|uniref:DUF3307 domain-containing protein n=1 Tax=Krasilnikovia sp. M28-CT-15 TaxID=3373540 RepID=UPI0038772DAA
MTAQLAAAAAVFAALFAAHHVADHWIQTDHQAAHKGLPGWVGARSCLAHVATYTLTALVALLALAVTTGWRPAPALLTAGLTVSAITHYAADRRSLLFWLAQRTGSRAFWTLGAPRPDRDDKPCLGTGAYALDQSWHVGWLYVAALIIAA